MKKMLFALVAMVAMVGCSKDELLEVDREQIAFGDVFVDNATRADYSSGNTVESFKVYGTIAVPSLGTTAQIFNGSTVKRDGKANGVAWDCDNIQYWMPKATYNFAAIVDGEAATTTALPATINHVVADGTANKDLLYATATVTTNANAAPTGVNDNGVVAFNFSHLLSKIQFKITNATNQTYQVTSIAVTGVAEDGAYTVSTGEWAKVGTDTTNLTFGTATVAGGATIAANATRQILPVEQTLAVTITYDVLDSNNQVVGTLTKSGTISSQTFAKNTVYVVTATLTGTAIDFSLGTVGVWGTEDGSITI